MEKIEEFIDKLEDNIRWWKRAMETDGFESDEEGELQENSVCANFAHTGSDGKQYT